MRSLGSRLPSRENGTPWVVAQFAAIAAIVLVSGLPPRWPTWVSLAGIPLVAAGAGLFALGIRALSRNLTVFPEPRAGGQLVEHGAYRFVRHPIYGGALLVFAGIGLVSSVWSLLGSLVLAAIWVAKSRVEEQRLLERFPGYAAYRERVRWRFLPFL